MKVLLVDDDDDIRKIGALSLAVVGKFDTSSASSAALAIELAKSMSPDVILMDMMMPGMDGLEALEQIRQTPELAHTPVIFMTAKVQRNEVAGYMAKGASGVIHKPFDPMTLPDEVRRILAASRCVR